MKVSQKRAIFYSIRDRKLKKLEEMGLLEEYKAFNQGKKHHTIEWFCKSKGIRV